MKEITTQNAKTIKGEKKNYLTGILYFSPHKSSGLGNVCASASPGCIESCLNTAGRAQMFSIDRKTGKKKNIVLDGRKRKTTEYIKDRKNFLAKIDWDIQAVIRKAKRENMIPCFRLNGTSDRNDLDIMFAKKYPDVQFYGYTKNFKYLLMDLPKNYDITFSRSEINEKQWKQALALGFNVAVVFHKDSMPKKQWQNFPVKIGDETDLRFLDGKQKNGFGKIIALTAKGKAKKDITGFTVMTEKQRQKNIWDRIKLESDNPKEIERLKNLL